ncbi:MAG: protein kinase [Gemmatimonadales bacterium]
MTDHASPAFLAFQTVLLGRYSLQRELGRGGMGIVYLARDVRLDRDVAIKVLPPELGAQPALRERFLREARTSAKLSHPYIVPIYSVEETRDFVYFAMAYVDGETLAQRIATRGPVVPSDATRILREVSWALAYAHAQGVIHRDVKPANILLEHGSGRALVADFGIARLVEGDGYTTGEERLGTPEFMSPEQASGETIDGRSDLYSLGVVGFVALTGQLPFQADTVQGMLAQHITRPAPSLASMAPGVPRALAQAVDRCLAKDPASRFESGEALANALDTSLTKQPDVPVPIRVYLDRRHFFAPFIPMMMGLPVFLSHLVQYLRDPGAWVLYKAVAELGAAGLAVILPVGYLFYRARSLFKLGYGPEDIVLALRTSFDRRREEFLYEYGLVPSARERLARLVAVAGMAITVVGSAAILSGAFGRDAMFRLPWMFLSGYVATIAGLFSQKWARLRSGKGPVWGRIWAGPFGRAVNKLASIGLGPRAIAADRRTELAIAMSAESLYASLPKEARRGIEDLPETLKRLEGNARKIRERLDAIDASIANAQRSPTAAAPAQREALTADLRAAREQAQARLQDVITSMETLRLNLLRLGAGAGSSESLTADLNAARELGDQTDRLLQGRQEVERALRSASS